MNDPNFPNGVESDDIVAVIPISQLGESEGFIQRSEFSESDNPADLPASDFCTP